ncbi:MAG: hypothetical protein PHD65_08455 [Gallionella sp.]|nr:hypothetical protein [Gallionella sp.]
MEVKDWITIASAFIIAIGWFVTGYLNRVKDVAQKRLEYRLKTLEAFLPVWFAIVNDNAALLQPEILAQFEDARRKFHLYGYKDENELMDQLVLAIGNKKPEEFTTALRKLVPLVRSRIRDELKINA